MSERGVHIALPVAVALGQPLLFREWRPNARMARGLWKIPYPADGAEVVPSVVIAPVVGFDKDCFASATAEDFSTELWPASTRLR